MSSSSPDRPPRGKSALALALAERRGGTVINADAMQTYDAFPILTAQPTAEERARVPHALYGVLPLSETLSAARWRALAIGRDRALPTGAAILCGGSGLYLRTLMQGISAIPAIACRGARPGECRLGRDGRRRLPGRAWPSAIRRSSHG